MRSGARAAAAATTSTQALAAQLLRLWRKGLPSSELTGAGPPGLRAAALRQVEFGRVRRRGTTLVRVTGIDAQRGGTAAYAEVELVTDDMPFLVDTLGMALSAAGYAVQLIVHPILHAVRDGAGRLRGFAADGGGSGSCRESWQYLRIDPVSGEAEVEHLRARIAAALADVRRACGDWQAMRAAASAAAASLRGARGRNGARSAAEAAELLAYMADNHFTFLGMERLERQAGGRMAQVAGGSLGVLRRRGAGRRGVIAAPGADRNELLIVSKSDRRSTVHRPGYLDSVAVREFDRSGSLRAEMRWLGMWTSNTYHADPRSIPHVRQKVEQVIARFDFAPASHDAKRLVSILDNLPRDELFQASAEELRSCASAVLGLHERASGVCLVLRRDRQARFWSCLVFLPRERLDNDAFRRIESVLASALGGGQVDSSLAVGDAPLAQLHVTVRAAQGDAPAVRRHELERRVAEAVITWRDRLRQALRAELGHARAAELWPHYGQAFSAAYRLDVEPELAVRDVLDLEAGLGEHGLLRLRQAAQPGGHPSLRLLRHGDPLSISVALPIFENFGMRTLAERPYEVRTGHGRACWIQDFELEAGAMHGAGGPGLEEQLNLAFGAVLAGEIDNDGFHRLITSAGLTVSQTRVLRAVCRYLLQTGIPFSQAYIERALHHHSGIARMFWQLFELRLDPARSDARSRREAVKLERRVRHAIAEVSNPDEDRILRGFLNVILATVRTNHFRDGAGARPLVLKLLPQQIPGIPEPRPAYELFVHGTRVEGVHLRKGPIARGGIRWSERPEDFRTEVLGLMKAQHVKNTLIVPVGAKGGFVARLLRPGSAPDERGREVVACYRAFIAGLLEVTDNIVAGKVAPPQGVRRRDGDDPYLVVAADKGTATFSDTANAISLERGFWLGDAFASGGSAGYDHKKMGITARGAWECVKRHFREIGVDIMRQPFTVAGIGDMSGDVFGNGMLLSRHLRLVAAFDHRHIFIDPAPDAARGHRERSRLFALPRSSWADYDRRALSRGGQVLERSHKTLQLTPESQQLLGLPHPRATPIEIIRAILKMQVDLLWNGGIGTYVKASEERHGEIGDRANDGLRVDGRELRARVVGEGGNLGFSQRGRIEYASHGGRINTDFVDNSAGVNTSDIEVNLKIMLAEPAGARVPRGKARVRLLASVTGEVAAQVLRNNYLQSEALSLLEARSRQDLGDHQQLMRALERGGEMNRALECLPSDSDIEERAQRGEGLTRPELAVVLAWSKLALNQALTDTDIAADPYHATELERYFPVRWRKRYARAIAGHRLRRQLVATATTNSILNRMDPGFVMRMSAQTGADTAAVARAYTIARDSAGLRELWTAIEELDNRVAASAQYEALLATRDYVEQLTRRLVLGRGRGARADIGAEVRRLTPAFVAARAMLPACLPGIAGERYAQQYRELGATQLPPALAGWLAGLSALRATPDLAAIAEDQRRPLAIVARQYFQTAAALGIDWLGEAIRRLATSGSWQAVARERLYTACLDGQARLGARALRERAGEGAALERWVSRLGAPGQRWQLTLAELRHSAQPDLAALMAAAEALRDLSHGA